MADILSESLLTDVLIVCILIKDSDFKCLAWFPISSQVIPTGESYSVTMVCSDVINHDVMKPPPCS